MELNYVLNLYNKTGIITSMYKWYHPQIAFTFIAILSMIAFFGVFGNLLIVLAVFTTKELNFEGNLFVVNLAFADMSISGFVDTMNVVGIVEGEVFFLDKIGICKFIGSTCLTSCICSLLNISFVGINRFVFIVKNPYYRKFFTRRSCYLICLILWPISFILQMSNYLGWGGYIYDRKTLSCIYNRMADHSFTIYFAGFIVSLPVLVTSYCYIRIYTFWKEVSSKVSNLSGKSQSAQVKSIKLARMLFLLFFIYVMCWTPYAIVAIADIHDTFSEFIHVFAVTLAHLNSTINPILYGVTNQQFKEAYFRLFRKILCMKPAENVKLKHMTESIAI